MSTYKQDRTPLVKTTAKKKKVSGNTKQFEKKILPVCMFNYHLWGKKKEYCVCVTE